MLSTKANTLDALSRELTRGRVNRLVFFTDEEWSRNPIECLSMVQTRLNGTVAVRSSAINEDTLSSSNAGAFHSELGVPSGDREALATAIQLVFDSYGEKDSADPENQVLVQEQNSDIVASGVCTTRSLDDAPYYVITYAEGSDTAVVTSGGGSKVVKIFRGCVQIPDRFARLMATVFEIERIFPDSPLDIEFGITASGEILVFQTRALVLTSGRERNQDDLVRDRLREIQNEVAVLTQPSIGLSGQTTFLADMTDWNPAEMIGDRSSDLAFSLYKELITGEIWSTARASQGYLEIGSRDLVHLIGNKPYVDIRACFNSFLPADLPELLRDRLISFYLAEFQADPARQDKVEFEVLFTCYDASFATRSEKLLDRGFSPEEVETLRASLIRLTNNLLDPEAISRDIEKTRQIDSLIRHDTDKLTTKEKLELANRYLEECKQFGTLPFARLARLGFISAAILKGFVPEVLSQADYEAFYYTVNTVARELLVDAEQFSRGQMSATEFLARYGHLRPGTYEITSYRYDEQELRISAPAPRPEKRAELSKSATHALWKALREHGLRGSVLQLFSFARIATEAREEAKFHFTKLLSEVLRLYAEVGSTLGFSREVLAHLRVDDFREAATDIDIGPIWAERIERRTKTLILDSQIDLPPVIFTPMDLEVVVPYSARPTFVTQKAVTADVAVLRDGGGRISVTDKIVVLERGDPGYDWIFTQHPAGLITKYGGAGSHMAIRCNEFALPAAIGCGEELFRVAQSGSPITLDCGSKMLRSASLRL